MFRFAALFLTTSAVMLGQTLDDTVIPRKTELFISLERSINTRTASKGDKFYGRLAVPITQNDQIVVPAGTYVIGHVGDAEQAGYVKGKAQVVLRFDTIILPDGRTRNIEAIVQSAENEAVDRSGEEGRIESVEDSQGKEVAGGAAGGATTGAAIGGLATRSWKGLGVGAAVGAAGGALIGLFQKGEHVVLERGTTLTIQLLDDIRFIKPEPPRAGTPLKP